MFKDSISEKDVRRRASDRTRERRDLHSGSGGFRIKCMLSGVLDVNDPQPAEIQGIINGKLQTDSPPKKLRKLVNVDSDVILGKIAVTVKVIKNSKVGDQDPDESGKKVKVELYILGELHTDVEDLESVRVNGIFESELEITGDQKVIQSIVDDGEPIGILRGKITGEVYVQTGKRPLDIVVEPSDEIMGT